MTKAFCSMLLIYVGAKLFLHFSDSIKATFSAVPKPETASPFTSWTKIITCASWHNFVQLTLSWCHCWSNLQSQVKNYYHEVHNFSMAKFHCLSSLHWTHEGLMAGVVPCEASNHNFSCSAQHSSLHHISNRFSLYHPIFVTCSPRKSISLSVTPQITCPIPCHQPPSFVRAPLSSFPPTHRG